MKFKRYYINFCVIILSVRDVFTFCDQKLLRFGLILFRFVVNVIARCASITFCGVTVQSSSYRRFISRSATKTRHVQKDLPFVGFINLQNRRISEASATHERAREARERARSAMREKSACSHTTVYALPPPDTPLMASKSQC